MTQEAKRKYKTAARTEPHCLKELSADGNLGLFDYSVPDT